MSKSFDKHLAAIRSGKIERTNIIGMRKALNAWDRALRGYSISGEPITTAQADTLTQAIKSHHPTALGELHEGGLKVLRNPRYAKRWTEQQRRIIDGACRFDLVRFDWIGPRQAHCVPVWRVISRDAEAFTFRNIPWQSAWSLGEEDGPRAVND